MRRISVYLTEKEQEALKILAAQSLRSPKEQAAFSIRETLIYRGLLNANDKREDEKIATRNQTYQAETR